MGARDPMGDFLDRLEEDGSGAALLPAFLPGHELSYKVDQGMIRLLCGDLGFIFTRLVY